MTSRPVLASIAFCALALPASAQCFRAKLKEAASNVDDHFGVQVVRHDDVLFVSERGADEAGAVHVFTELADGWHDLATLVPAATAPGLRFGASLAADGDVVVIGSRELDAGGYPARCGAWIFVRDRGTALDSSDDKWLELQHLELADPAANSFGWSVALQGGTALIGAPAAKSAWICVQDDGGTPTLFDDQWTLQAQLDPDAASPHSQIGVATALMDGGTLALASDPGDTVGSDGGILLYARDDHGTTDPLDDTWSAAGQIEAPAGGTEALSNSFVVDGDRLFAEEARDSTKGLPDGLIDVYERQSGTWSLVQQIDDPLGDFGPFGRSMAASGDTLVVGGLSWMYGPPVGGRQLCWYARVAGTWTLQSTLFAADESNMDGFGLSVALEDSRLFAGSPGGPYVDDDQAVEGAVWVVDLDVANGWTRLDHGGGGTPLLGGWGCLEAGAPVTVRAYETFEAGSLALLVVGASEVDLPIKSYLLLPSPDFLIPAVLGPIGDAEFSGAWPSGLASGTSLWFQAWVDDGFHGWYVSKGLQATQP
jgi:hypothetical protein